MARTTVVVCSGDIVLQGPNMTQWASWIDERISWLCFRCRAWHCHRLCSVTWPRLPNSGICTHRNLIHAVECAPLKPAKFSIGLLNTVPLKWGCKKCVKNNPKPSSTHTARVTKWGRAYRSGVYIFPFLLLLLLIVSRFFCRSWCLPVWSAM